MAMMYIRPVYVVMCNWFMEMRMLVRFVDIYMHMNMNMMLVMIVLVTVLQCVVCMMVHMHFSVEKEHAGNHD